MASVLQFQSHPKWSALTFAACSSAAHLRHLPRRAQQDSPLAAFEGIWRPWTESAAPRPIDPKAMPVILTTPEEYEIWLTAPAEVALELQRPLRDDMLEIVAEGARAHLPEVA